MKKICPHHAVTALNRLSRRENNKSDQNNSRVVRWVVRNGDLVSERFSVFWSAPTQNPESIFLSSSQGSGLFLPTGLISSMRELPEMSSLHSLSSVSYTHLTLPTK